MPFDAQQYRDQLKKLLPQGYAWPREPGNLFEDLLLGIADELSRVDARVSDLLREADPKQTVELITDWERLTGLPDECSGLGTTLQQRRDAVVAKLAATGGQSRSYFIQLAADIGFTITITEPRPFRFGINSMGDALYGEEWLFWWFVDAPEETITYFRFGQSAMGEPFRAWGNVPLECIINQYKPAHTGVIFRYGS